MPCDKCGESNRSLGYENGDEIQCRHCGQHLILINRKYERDGNWQSFEDVIES
jgi:DNA-directed RNA polymerase subunit RPC12/RpoP